MKYVKYLIIFIFLFYFFILFTGNRVLIFSKKVEPGDSYIAEGYGNLGESKQASLVCNYFTGYNITQSVFWYSPNNIMGRDSCPFLYKS